MGTNYYLTVNEVCSECGRGEEQIHIGKSSGGWHFLIHVIPERKLYFLSDWQKFWKGKQITNQYGTKLSKKQMLDRIRNRKYHGTLGNFRSEDVYQQNNAESGLNGLLRPQLDGNYCIGHGDGTWDYITGDFS